MNPPSVPDTLRAFAPYATPLDKPVRARTLARRLGLGTAELREVLLALGQPIKNGLTPLEPVFAQTLQDSGLAKEVLR